MRQETKKRGRGRPRIDETEDTIQIAIRLTRSQDDWLARRDGKARVIRELIDAAMAKDPR